MQSYIKFTIVVFVILLSSCQIVLGDGISSQELIEQGKAYDNRFVEYQGEVIGDIMNRGEYTWINVNDGSNAIGIWINSLEAKKISYSGTYKFTGDIVNIQGTFHRACSEHGGDLDIHASKLEIVERGAPRFYQTSKYRILFGTMLPVLALLLYVIYKKSSKN